jgi:hypothetical protein
VWGMGGLKNEGGGGNTMANVLHLSLFINAWKAHNDYNFVSFVKRIDDVIAFITHRAQAIAKVSINGMQQGIANYFTHTLQKLSLINCSLPSTPTLF